MITRRQRGCPTDGELRFAIEADDTSMSSVRAHIDQCAACQERGEELRAAADWSTQAIAGLAEDGGDPDVNLAYNRFRTLAAGGPVADSAGGSRMGQLFAARSMRAATAVVATIAVVVAVTFTPMRTMADDFLNQFRVQKFAAVTIPMDMLAPLEGLAGAELGEGDMQGFQDALGQLGALDTTFEFDEHNLPDPITLEEAEAQFGDIDEPDDLPAGFDSAPNAYLTEAGSASYEMDTATAQMFIDALNLPIYSLPDPEQYPTLEFGVDVPAGAVLEYQNEAGERIVVGQMASPSLQFPDGLDMNALREDILQFPGLPADLVAQLRAIDDWESTLIIPVPEGAESEDVTINGEPGLLITHELGSAILWEKDGILYGVIGQVSDDEVRDVADSMQ
jgi:anti-sigma factor RsiW